jgi:hypothetical protein
MGVGPLHSSYRFATIPGTGKERPGRSAPGATPAYLDLVGRRSASCFRRTGGRCTPLTPELRLSTCCLTETNPYFRVRLITPKNVSTSNGTSPSVCLASMLRQYDSTNKAPTQRPALVFNVSESPRSSPRSVWNSEAYAGFRLPYLAVCHLAVCTNWLVAMDDLDHDIRPKPWVSCTWASHPHIEHYGRL